MPFDAPCNQTGLSPSIPPQLAESTFDQQLQPGYFNCLPVEVIQHIANKLTLPDALRLKQTCHNANNSIDQKIIEDLRHRIQFKNMKTVVHSSKYESLKSIYNSGKFDHFFKRYVYDQHSGLVKDPERVDIKCFLAIIELGNATTKYKDEKYTMYTGLFENGHVFLIAPRHSSSIEEDTNTNNPNKVLFNGNTYSVNIEAIYSGRSFQEVKKLINIVHSNTPLSKHISHILEHEYK
ncbi:F-box protein [Thalassotalea sp. G20_0]|uniref:F-box protein n=1 Tax=Thalassotalea sp. G20_0 TaxID=2821093 RepID=UPI001ADA2E32|nr:F-box protein [Thalassotalea sp. G20_0]MBO9496756.1 F-box protein [Thalassotalea sp. G20_0]